MTMLHKLVLASTLFATALWGQVTPSAWVVPSQGPDIFDGGWAATPDTVTYVLDGTAAAGVSRTELTLWLPDGTPQVWGDVGLGWHSFAPSGGPGTYSFQFRLVDNNGDYADQWVSFTVTSGYLVPNAAVFPSGSDVVLVQDGLSSIGVAWTESVVWRPDGAPDSLGRNSLGAISYTPMAGSGQYWYQYRIVDNNMNYRDQWVPFWVP